MAEFGRPSLAISQVPRRVPSARTLCVCMCVCVCMRACVCICSSGVWMCACVYAQSVVCALMFTSPTHTRTHKDTRTIPTNCIGMSAPPSLEHDGWSLSMLCRALAPLGRSPPDIDVDAIADVDGKARPDGAGRDESLRTLCVDLAALHKRRLKRRVCARAAKTARRADQDSVDAHPPITVAVPTPLPTAVLPTPPLPVSALLTLPAPPRPAGAVNTNSSLTAAAPAPAGSDVGRRRARPPRPPAADSSRQNPRPRLPRTCASHACDPSQRADVCCRDLGR